MGSKGAAWMELFRFPLALTVAGDLLAGAAAAGSGPGPWLLPAFAGSACIFLGGVVLNDVVDLPEDRKHRPGRPLPSGRVGPYKAMGAGLGLLVAGILLPWAFLPEPSVLFWLALAGTAAFYDLALKQRARWGPWILGACRALDTFAGGFAATRPGRPFLPLAAAAFLVGVYAGLVTFQAGKEVRPASPSRNRAGLLPLLPALFLAGLFSSRWEAIFPLAFLAGDGLWSYYRSNTTAGARRLTGAWIRGYLLLGSTLLAGKGFLFGGAGLWVVWFLLTWSLWKKEQS